MRPFISQQFVVNRDTVYFPGEKPFIETKSLNEPGRLRVNSFVRAINDLVVIHDCQLRRRLCKVGNCCLEFDFKILLLERFFEPRVFFPMQRDQLLGSFQHCNPLQVVLEQYRFFTLFL